MGIQTVYLRMRARKIGKAEYEPDPAGAWYYAPVMGSEDRGRRPAWQIKAEQAAKSRKSRGFQYRLPNRAWSQQFDSITDAEAAANKQSVMVAAAERGLTPEQYEADPSRVTLRSAVERYLEAAQVRSPRTVKQYTFHLEEFLVRLPRHIRFLDQIDARVLQGYVNGLIEAGAAPKTVENKMGTVWFLLKHAGIAEPSKKFRVNLPAVEEEDAVPYTSAELKRIFDALAKHYPSDRPAFMFMLMTACRKGEVAHATWKDIDWQRKEFIVRSKTWTDPRTGETKRWTVKTHESRRVPLSDDLIHDLRQMQKTTNTEWLFPNEEGQPEGHQDRILKHAAKQAGMNPEECKLHRFRKTRATWWHETQKLSVRRIQKYLGHKSLETTMKYLGMTDTADLQEELNAPMWEVA